MGATNYHIKLLEDFAEEIDKFIEQHKGQNCSQWRRGSVEDFLDWQEASPILYSIKIFESTTDRWVRVKCEKCSKERIII